MPPNNKKKSLKDMIEDALRRAPPIEPPSVEQIIKATHERWEAPPRTPPRWRRFSK